LNEQLRIFKERGFIFLELFDGSVAVEEENAASEFLLQGITAPLLPSADSRRGKSKKDSLQSPVDMELGAFARGVRLLTAYQSDEIV